MGDISSKTALDRFYKRVEEDKYASSTKSSFEIIRDYENSHQFFNSRTMESIQKAIEEAFNSCLSLVQEKIDTMAMERRYQKKGKDYEMAIMIKEDISKLLRG